MYVSKPNHPIFLLGFARVNKKVLLLHLLLEAQKRSTNISLPAIFRALVQLSVFPQASQQTVFIFIHSLIFSFWWFPQIGTVSGPDIKLNQGIGVPCQ